MSIVLVLILGGLLLFLMWWTEPTQEELEDKRARQEDY